MEQFVRLMKKCTMVCMVASICFILSGCAKDPYTNASIQYRRMHNQVISGEGIKETFKNLPAIISNTIKDYAVSTIMVSILIGALLIKLVPNELKIRKKVIMTFFVVIPTAILLLTYGTAWFARVLK